MSEGNKLGQLDGFAILTVICLDYVTLTEWAKKINDRTDEFSHRKNVEHRIFEVKQKKFWMMVVLKWHCKYLDKKTS